MSQGPYQRIVESQATVQFTDGLAINGGTSQVWNIPCGWVAGRTAFNIRNIYAQAMQAFDMKLHLFRTAAGALASTPDASTWMGYAAFYAANALQQANSGLFLYQWADVLQPYFDLDAINAAGDVPWNLHAVLVNADAAQAKSAGAPGAIKFTFTLEGTGE